MADDERNHEGPSRDIVNVVLKRYLIISRDEILAPLLSAPLSNTITIQYAIEVCSALESCISAGELPFLLIQDFVLNRHFYSIHAAENIRSLKWVGNDRRTEDEKRSDALSSAHQRMDEFIRSEEGSRLLRDRTVEELHKALERGNVHDATIELMSQIMLSIWSAFESCTKSFLQSWFNMYPHDAIRVISDPNMAKVFGKNLIDHETIEQYGFNLSTCMGDIMFHGRRIDSLTLIRQLLDLLFPCEEVRTALQGEMWLLNQRRHLIVHRRGRVDQEYLTKTGDVLSLGSRLILSGDDIERYILAIRDAVTAICRAADTAK